VQIKLLQNGKFPRKKNDDILKSVINISNTPERNKSFVVAETAEPAGMGRASVFMESITHLV